MMTLDEFMDIQEAQHNKRYDELAAKVKDDHDRGLEAAKLGYTVQKYEKEKLDEDRKNLGYGSW